MKIHHKSKIKDPNDIENVCKMYAEGFSAHDIVKEFLSKYPTINYYNIYHIIKNSENQKSIEKYRAVYLQNPLTVALAHKKVRLEDLNRERMRIIASIDKQCDKDGLIVKTGWSRYTTLVKRLIEIEIAGRDEVEKKPDLLEEFSKIGPLATMSTEELRKYDRKLTIELTAAKREGISLPELSLPEINSGAGVETPAKGKPA